LVLVLVLLLQVDDEGVVGMADDDDELDEMIDCDEVAGLGSLNKKDLS